MDHPRGAISAASVWMVSAIGEIEFHCPVQQPHRSVPVADNTPHAEGARARVKIHKSFVGSSVKRVVSVLMVPWFTTVDASLSQNVQHLPPNRSAPKINARRRNVHRIDIVGFCSKRDDVSRNASENHARISIKPAINETHVSMATNASRNRSANQVNAA
jgi:hypothetical protein